MEKRKITDAELMNEIYQLQDKAYELMSELKDSLESLHDRTTAWADQNEIVRLKRSTLTHFDSTLTDISGAIAWLEDYCETQRYQESENITSTGNNEETKKAIKQFNADNVPFYIVEHDNGEYSLCLPFSFLNDKYRDFGQEAFNRYAERIGEEPVTERGFYTHGSGYEWETVFRKTFEKDSHIGEINFDCELSGFFCYAKSLETIADFGHRFRELCMDEKAFSELVYEALIENENQTKISEDEGVHYFDKNGNEIKAGMTIRMEDGSLELVYATEDQYGNPNLGINATNEEFLKYHPDWAREYYSLSMFDMGKVEICPMDMSQAEDSNDISESEYSGFDMKMQ